MKTQCREGAGKDQRGAREEGERLSEDAGCSSYSLKGGERIRTVREGELGNKLKCLISGQRLSEVA